MITMNTQAQDKVSINQLAFNFWEANQQDQDDKQYFARNREGQGRRNTEVRKINEATYYIPDNMSGEALKKHLVKESVNLNTQVF